MYDALATMSAHILTHAQVWTNTKLGINSSSERITSPFSPPFSQSSDPVVLICHADDYTSKQTTETIEEDKNNKKFKAGTNTCICSTDGDITLDTASHADTKSDENNNNDEKENQNSRRYRNKHMQDHNLNDNHDDIHYPTGFDLAALSTLTNSFTETHEDSPAVHTHYIFLSHGFKGSPKEMGYIEESLTHIITKMIKKSSSSPSSSPTGHVTEDNDNKKSNSDDSVKHSMSGSIDQNKYSNCRIRIHSAEDNHGKTHDGIANGGARLAKEMKEFIQNDILSLQNKNKCPHHLEENCTVNSKGNNAEPEQQQTEHHVSLSLIGFSLGGLYARYAISCLPEHIYVENNKITIHSNIFVSAASPHIGCASNTFMKIPRRLEKTVATMFGGTGDDLFQMKKKKKKKGRKFSSKTSSLLSSSSSSSSVSSASSSSIKRQENKKEDLQVDGLIFDMATNYDRFLKPLSKFKKRIAYANAFRTDFLVPTTTAGFLSKRSEYPHIIQQLPIDHQEEKNEASFLVTTAETEPNHQLLKAEVPSYKSKSDKHLIMSNRLDALGWSKVFIDTRSMNPIPSVPKFTRSQRDEWFNFVQEQHKEKISFAKDSHENDTISSQTGHSIDINSLTKSSLSGSSNAVIVQSKDLNKFMTKSDRISLPLGHSLMIASQKAGKFYSGGKPIMDSLANNVVNEMMKMS